MPRHLLARPLRRALGTAGTPLRRMAAIATITIALWSPVQRYVVMRVLVLFALVALQPLPLPLILSR